MIAGFGQTSDGGERSVIKKVATVRAVGDYECRSEYRRAAIDDRICAQGEEGTDACKGKYSLVTAPHIEKICH